jgi:hypothetical protein
MPKRYVVPLSVHQRGLFYALIDKGLPPPAPCAEPIYGSWRMRRTRGAPWRRCDLPRR